MAAGPGREGGASPPPLAKVMAAKQGQALPGGRMERRTERTFFKSQEVGAAS